MNLTASQTTASIPVLVGPFPRPFHRGGVSTTNAKLAGMLDGRGIVHDCIDLAPDRESKGLVYHWSRLTRVLAGVGRILGAPSGTKRNFELSIDGGGGVIYNILLAAAARLRGGRLILYHHSTRYVLADDALMRLLVHVAGRNPTHIACSPRMLALFRDRYDAPGNFQVLSNAAWIAPSPVPQIAPDPDRIALGYLGVLWENKGVLRALDTFKELRRRGQNATIKFAGGNMAQDVREGIEATQREYGDEVVLLGNISDAEKWALFASLDYFLFPTLYPHETQSSVAPEAMSAGVPVIAYDHRFVGELIGSEGGLVIPAETPFAPAAADWIMSGLDVGTRLERRRRARAHYDTIYAEGAAQLESLIDQLVAP